MAKTYRDELMRALDRSDAASLREKVELYYAFNKADGKGKEALLDLRFRDFDPYFFANDDPEIGIAVVALAASMYDDEEFLGVMAAGPLENLLSKPRPDILERVLSEARKNARFRWLLRGIFLHAIPEEARHLVVAAIGNMSEADPLPPR